MTDFSIRSDNVDVEQIMRQIRARIREKRGVDYTEEEIRELANVKLEKFLDPRGVRSDLLHEFRRGEPDPNYEFEEDTLVRSSHGMVEWVRRLFAPLIKVFVNLNPLIRALHIQSRLNADNATRHQLYYELIHNLVVETTRLGIEVKNLKMRVESLDARVDFSERRARALEGAVMYRPQVEDLEDTRRPAPPDRGASRPMPPITALPSQIAQSIPGGSGGTGTPTQGSVQESAGQRSRRRRRRRGRRGGAPAAAIMGAPSGAQGSAAAPPEPVESDALPSASDAEFNGDSESHEPSTSSGQSEPDDER